MNKCIDSNTSPLLAVIVPVYKVEKYLSKCLDSIINQSYKNLQIICVNDGSPDCCADIINYYAQNDPRIVVINKENGGLSSARNAALDLLYKIWLKNPNYCAKYITFVDSDDYLAKDIYNIAMGKFVNDVDMVTFGYEEVYEYDFDKVKNKYYKPNLLDLSGKQIVTKNVLFNMVIAVWNKVFKTEIIFKNNIRFPEGILFEDLFFTPIYLINSKSVWLEDTIGYSYLRREDSITSSKNYYKEGIAIHYLYLVELMYHYLTDHGVFEFNKDLYIRYFWLFIATAIHISKKGREEQRIYEKALNLMFTIKDCNLSLVQKHYKSLLEERRLKESNCYKFLWIIKVKHRLDYDKYYFIGFPFAKIVYTDKHKLVSIFNFIKFKLN